MQRQKRIVMWILKGCCVENALRPGHEKHRHKKNCGFIVLLTIFIIFVPKKGVS